MQESEYKDRVLEMIDDSDDAGNQDLHKWQTIVNNNFFDSLEQKFKKKVRNKILALEESERKDREIELKDKEIELITMQKNLIDFSHQVGSFSSFTEMVNYSRTCHYEATVERTTASTKDHDSPRFTNNGVYKARRGRAMAHRRFEDMSNANKKVTDGTKSEMKVVSITLDESTTLPLILAMLNQLPGSRSAWTKDAFNAVCDKLADKIVITQGVLKQHFKLGMTIGEVQTIQPIYKLVIDGIMQAFQLPFKSFKAAAKLVATFDLSAPTAPDQVLVTYVGRTDYFVSSSDDFHPSAAVLASGNPISIDRWNSIGRALYGTLKCAGASTSENSSELGDAMSESGSETGSGSKSGKMSSQKSDVALVDGIRSLSLTNKLSSIGMQAQQVYVGVTGSTLHELKLHLEPTPSLSTEPAKWAHWPAVSQLIFGMVGVLQMRDAFDASARPSEVAYKVVRGVVADLFVSRFVWCQHDSRQDQAPDPNRGPDRGLPTQQEQQRQQRVVTVYLSKLQRTPHDFIMNFLFSLTAIDDAHMATIRAMKSVGPEERNDAGLDGDRKEGPGSIQSERAHDQDEDAHGLGHRDLDTGDAGGGRDMAGTSNLALAAAGDLGGGSTFLALFDADEPDCCVEDCGNNGDNNYDYEVVSGDSYRMGLPAGTMEHDRSRKRGGEAAAGPVPPLRRVPLATLDVNAPLPLRMDPSTAGSRAASSTSPGASSRASIITRNTAPNSASTCS